MPVGMFTSRIASSAILLRYLYSARSELPCAVTSTVWPTLSCGAIASCQYGSTRSSVVLRSEEHTSELQSLMRISYAVFCLKKKKKLLNIKQDNTHNRIE